jgi:cytochrome c oxidase subunit 3
MASTATEAPKIEGQSNPSPRVNEPGNGGWKGPAGGDFRAVKDYSPPPSSTGIWVVLASITMTFLAFTSALVVRQGSANDWHHLPLPGILYLNTAILVASSVTLERGRRGFRSFAAGLTSDSVENSRWIYVTLFLGILFVAGQFVAWGQLRSQGLFLATNPNSSFFYVLTVIHAIHVTGGIGGLTRVIYRMNKSVLRKSTLDATSTYWHFMGGLWVYLLLLLWIKL